MSEIRYMFGTLPRFGASILDVLVLLRRALFDTVELVGTHKEGVDQ